jgi:hypothetical protein
MAENTVEKVLWFKDKEKLPGYGPALFDLCVTTDNPIII